MQNNNAVSPGPTKPLRVLMISEYPRGGKIEGGVESAAQILAEALSGLSEIENITVLNFRTDIVANETLRLNEKLTIEYMVGQRRWNLPTRCVLSWWRAKRYAARFHPDVVHGQSTAAPGDISVRLGYPSVVTIHGVGTYEVELRERNNGWIGRLRVALSRLILRDIERSATVIVALSDFVVEYLKPIRKKHIVKIPNAVRSEFFAGLRSPVHNKHLAFVGLLIVRKNITGLLRAFRRVLNVEPDTVLHLIGDAPDKEYNIEIQNTLDKTLRDHVVLHGGASGEELIHKINSCCALVLFSDFENLPCVIGEALALGKPVIATDVGGVSEMVAEGSTGSLVSPEDEEAMADRMIQIVRNPELCLRMGAEGAKRAREQWYPPAVAEKTVNAYRTAIEIARQ